VDDEATAHHQESFVDRQLQSPPERQLSCPVDGGNCRVN
jgi:hypothetical protein